ncbi:MAG: hypothetical protein HPZ91_10250 [Lentisphaeria bacterium]|nr:hypothetical protein [Lentisphaeria bacterium]
MTRLIWFGSLLLAAGMAARAADTLLLLPGGDAATAMSPNSQLAPWSLVAASGENSRIEAAVFTVKGIDPAMITGVMICSNIGEYEDYLLHFPYNRRNRAAKLTVDGQTIRAQFTPPVAVPATLTRKAGLLLGFALSDRAAGEFEITLKSLAFGPETVEPGDGARTVRIVPGQPAAEITVGAVEFPTGVPAVKVTVTPKQPPAFAPGIALQFPKLKISNFHSWGNLYRSQMTPVDDGKSYEFIWPEYALLSDNLLPVAEKKTSYQATPPPNNWKLRADNTGFDLFDADARGAYHASPGGIEFVGAERISMIIDLGREARIGGVSLYGLFGLKAISAGAAAAPEGPWSAPVSVQCAMMPQEQFGKAAPGVGVGLSPALFNLFFPELVAGRYIKLEIDGSRQIGVTEILVWGIDPARPAMVPNGATVYMTSETGAGMQKGIPIRKN